MSLAFPQPNHPEPVPAATQLAALPFLAAIDGYIRRETTPNSLRLTLHRVMNRNGDGYLQQVTPYVGALDYSPISAGRVFPVSEGIMGHAYKNRKVARTRRYENEFNFRADLSGAMTSTKDKRQVAEVASSYLAVPFLFGEDSIVAILYADAKQFNLFADDQLVLDVMALCDGFCRSLDQLIVSPLSGIRNYRLEQGRPVTNRESVYPKVQEIVDLRPVPRFERLRSFNFEISD
jgi:hypothetical protein